jgi:hypothetical protein
MGILRAFEGWRNKKRFVFLEIDVVGEELGRV